MIVRFISFASGEMNAFQSRYVFLEFFETDFSTIVHLFIKLKVKTHMSERT